MDRKDKFENYNTLVEINYETNSKKFELVSLFNPDNFNMSGKCKN